MNQIFYFKTLRKYSKQINQISGFADNLPAIIFILF